MLYALKSFVGNLVINNLGWKTSKKIVVFESDDWGGISMPDRSTYNVLLKKGIRVDLNPYTKFDSLASEEDLSLLFETLSRYKDSTGKSPIFTVNTNVANPDFKRIKAHEFQQYFYEPFYETLKRYPQHANSFKLWQQGINAQIFEPQFHGREHLNPNLWLEQLRLGKHKHFRVAFDHDFFNLPKTSYPGEKWILNSAFYPNSSAENLAIFAAINSGVDLFNDIFRTKPTAFIATGYFWHSDIEKFLAEKGISILQGLPLQKQPDYKTQTIKKTLNYTGKHNKYKQLYLIRNAFFEPTLKSAKDAISECLKRIELSFKYNKPAIISTHRLNYIGSIYSENRNRNLKLLNGLLSQIIKRWPEIEFMSTSQLAELVRQNRASG